MQNSEHNQFDSIDKTPIKYYGFKTNLYIKDNIATFQSSSGNKIGLVVLRIVVACFWGIVLYNIFTLNLLIADEAPLFISIIFTLVFYILGIFLTFYSFIVKIQINHKEFINKNTGEINLLVSNDKKKYNISDLIGIQLLTYEEVRKLRNHRSVSSYNVTVTLFQINIITNTKTRIPLIVTKNPNNAILFSRKLSDFLEKPLISNFTQENLENKTLIKSQKINKYSAIITAELETNIKTDINFNPTELVQDKIVPKNKLIVTKQKFDNFINNKDFDFEKVTTNKIKVLTEDKTLSYLHLPKKFQTITVSVNLYDTPNSPTKKIILKTNFRFDILANIILIPIFITFDSFIQLPKTSFINIIIGVTICLSIYRVLIFRHLEIESVKRIIEELLPNNSKS